MDIFADTDYSYSTTTPKLILSVLNVNISALPTFLFCEQRCKDPYHYKMIFLSRTTRAYDDISVLHTKANMYEYFENQT